MKERISEVPFSGGGESKVEPLPDADLSRLDAMSKEELVGLVRLCNTVQIGYALLTDEERKLALRVKLMELAMKADDDKVALNAINQLLDRIEGKPVGTAQNINIGGNLGPMTIEVILVDAASHKPKEMITIEG